MAFYVLAASERINERTSEMKGFFLLCSSFAHFHVSALAVANVVDLSLNFCVDRHFHLLCDLRRSCAAHGVTGFSHWQSAHSVVRICLRCFVCPCYDAICCAKFVPFIWVHFICVQSEHSQRLNLRDILVFSVGSNYCLQWASVSATEINSWRKHFATIVNAIKLCRHPLLNSFAFKRIPKCKTNETDGTMKLCILCVRKHEFHNKFMQPQNKKVSSRVVSCASCRCTVWLTELTDCHTRTWNSDHYISASSPNLEFSARVSDSSNFKQSS